MRVGSSDNLALRINHPAVTAIMAAVAIAADAIASRHIRLILNRAGRQQNSGNTTDPLGRPLNGREWSDDLTVKIPGEIDVQRVRRILEELRRRLADPQRPQIELDYIERLLKDY